MHHLYPDLAQRMRRAGWTLLCTQRDTGGVDLHAALCESLPPRCADREGLCEWIRTSSVETMERLWTAAWADLREHAATCGACDHALAVAVEYASREMG